MYPTKPFTPLPLHARLLCHVPLFMPPPSTPSALFLLLLAAGDHVLGKTTKLKRLLGDCRQALQVVLASHAQIVFFAAASLTRGDFSFQRSSVSNFVFPRQRSEFLPTMVSCSSLVALIPPRCPLLVFPVKEKTRSSLALVSLVGARERARKFCRWRPVRHDFSMWRSRC